MKKTELRELQRYLDVLFVVYLILFIASLVLAICLTLEGGVWPVLLAPIIILLFFVYLSYSAVDDYKKRWKKVKRAAERRYNSHV